MKDYMPLLSEVQLFHNIRGPELKPVLNCIGAYTRSYLKGNYIALSGDEINCIGIILSGKVLMLKEDIWGEKSILVVMRRGEIFGETFACGVVSSSTVSFKAAEDTEVLFMPYSRVIHSCSKACAYHHRLIENMVVLIANKNYELMEKIEVTSKKTLRERVLTFLSQQVQHKDELYFTVPMGRVELADYLCVDRSALTRELSHMKEEGLIDYDKNCFRLTKADTK